MEGPGVYSQPNPHNKERQESSNGKELQAAPLFLMPSKIKTKCLFRHAKMHFVVFFSINVGF